MKFLFSLFTVALLLVPPAVTRADDAHHRQAAESLLTLMGMEKQFSQLVDQMLQVQVQQNPAIAPYEKEMRDFLNKYMSWPSLKEDMIKVYVEQFTEAELKQLADFYRTPIGQKMVRIMPTLVAKGAEIGQKRVQEHLPELQAAIQAKSGASPR